MAMLNADVDGVELLRTRLTDATQSVILSVPTVCLQVSKRLRGSASQTHGYERAFGELKLLLGLPLCCFLDASACSSLAAPDAFVKAVHNNTASTDKVRAFMPTACRRRKSDCARASSSLQMSTFST